MTDNVWIDIAICVLCSVVGGLIVGTLFEFNPYGPSKVRRSVLITFWLIVLTVLPVVVSTYIWREIGFALSVVAALVLWSIFGTVIASVQEEESKDGS